MNPSKQSGSFEKMAPGTFLAASMQAFTLLELTTFTPGMANWFSSVRAVRAVRAVNPDGCDAVT